ncbi:MAG: HypC/HybG/HupF family hydrogenase formation chaperone [Chlorobi bacterium]|nr:HypC/HybG/HupF family hydrogenase formation chaperone [Chlorobiota bacterium]
MCLAIPGKVIEIIDENGLKMGKIDYAGSVSRACVEYCGDVEVGNYVIVHAGMAISVLDEQEALESIAIHQSLAEEAAKEGKDIFDNPLPKNNKGER